MARYKCVIAYDGTDYAGWQIQPDALTITKVLQNSFEKTFGELIKITGASRTDAGVHALGQVASFQTDIKVSVDKMLFAWNNSLPLSFSIRSLEIVSDEYRPRKNVAQKTYCYHFFLERPLPFVARYGYYHHFKIDLEKLKNALAFFVGTHDFRSFTSDEKENTVRTINAISIDYLKEYNAFRITIQGRSFLRFMIRRMVGACLKVASDPEISLDYLQQVLEEKNPNQWLPNAPAHGLVLFKIEYHNDSLVT